MKDSVFFLLSTALAWALQPETWLLLALCTALLFVWRGRRRAAIVSTVAALAITFAMFYSPAGYVLLRPLEQSIPFPTALPDKVNGIITLGGVISPALTAAYGKPQLGGEAERITEFVALARRYPQAKLVFSGDVSAVAPGSAINEAGALRRFLEDQGFDVARVTFEEKSRNTYESAIVARSLLKPQPGEVWILITSAYHMPRAAGTFRKAGWEVLPYPVSYRALPTFSLNERAADTIGLALHEWVGIAVYRATGRM